MSNVDFTKLVREPNELVLAELLKWEPRGVHQWMRLNFSDWFPGRPEENVFHTIGEWPESVRGIITDEFGKHLDGIRTIGSDLVSAETPKCAKDIIDGIRGKALLNAFDEIGYTGFRQVGRLGVEASTKELEDAAQQFVHGGEGFKFEKNIATVMKENANVHRAEMQFQFDAEMRAYRNRCAHEAEISAKRDAAIRAEQEALEELKLASNSAEKLGGEALISKEVGAAEESLLHRINKMSTTSKAAVGVAAVVGAAALGHWAMKIKKERDQNRDVATSPKR